MGARGSARPTASTCSNRPGGEATCTAHSQAAAEVASIIFAHLGQRGGWRAVRRRIRRLLAAAQHDGSYGGLHAETWDCSGCTARPPGGSGEQPAQPRVGKHTGAPGRPALHLHATETMPLRSGFIKLALLHAHADVSRRWCAGDPIRSAWPYFSLSWAHAIRRVSAPRCHRPCAPQLALSLQLRLWGPVWIRLDPRELNRCDAAPQSGNALAAVVCHCTRCRHGGTPAAAHRAPTSPTARNKGWDMARRPGSFGGGRCTSCRSCAWRRCAEWSSLCTAALPAQRPANLYG